MEKEDEGENSVHGEEEELDVWNVPELKDTGLPWKELDAKGKAFRVLFSWILKPICVLGLLYLFICSLSFLSSAFKLLGGKEAGKALSNNDVVSNPIAGLMIGVLATVLLQSSSTTTSILVSMVSAGIIDVKVAIPVVMGANIGTSVTNTIVSLGHVKVKNEFRRAFAGATVHDMFNFLSVIILLPLELITNYLYYLSKAIVDSFHLSERATHLELLSVLTNPFTKKIVQIDESVLANVTDDDDDVDKRLLKSNCFKGEFEYFYVKKDVICGGNDTLRTLTVTSRRYLPWNETRMPFNASFPAKYVNETNYINGTSWTNDSWLVKAGNEITGKCGYIFEDTSLSDAAVGAILLVIALLLLCFCLIFMVKLLHSLLKGRMAYVIKEGINADFPRPFGFLTGYVAILIGAGTTMLVQSSSVFTSALTPLVGLGVVTLERTYPLTLGANIGTTVTGILAAVASTGDFSNALQLAFCHLFFNITGVLLWYPVPRLRKLPIYLARGLGNTTANYKWFALFYMIIVFFLVPGSLFGLSVAGWYVLLGVAGPIALIFIAVVAINVLQKKKPQWIYPKLLRNWNFLPLWMHSLEPMDRVVRTSYQRMKKCCPRRRSGRYVLQRNLKDEGENGDTDELVRDFNDASAYGSHLVESFSSV